MDQMAKLSRTFEYIKKNCHRRLSLKELAATANLSPSRFHDVFKSVAGLPPVEFAARERMKAAQNMLASGDLSISEVAEELGFPEQFSFSRSFKAHFGISPSEYRKDVWKNLAL
jgi:AraC family transcriptional regulator